jgi:hypothetical protein
MLKAFKLFFEVSLLTVIAYTTQRATDSTHAEEQMATRLNTGDGKLTAGELLSFFDLSNPLPKGLPQCPGNQRMLACVELHCK